MAELVVGTLRTRLTLDSATFEAGARKSIAAEKQLSASLKTLQTAARQVSSAFLLTDIAGAVTKAVSSVSRIADASQRMGIGAEAVQRLAFAATQGGASLEAVATAMTRMSATLSGPGGVKALAQVGLTFKDIKGLSPDQTFTTIADAAAKLPDPLKQSAAMTQLFGRGAAELLPAVKAGFTAIGAQAPVMGAAVVTAGDDAGDALHKLQQSIDNLKAKALIPLVSAFTKLPESAQIGVGGIISFLPSLQTLAIGLLAIGGPSGAMAGVKVAALGLAGAFLPVAAAIAAVWAAWKIGNIDAIKNTIAEWTLRLQGMTKEQAHAAVTATAAAVAAAEQAKATTTATTATVQHTAVTQSYAAQLAAAQKELSALTASDRAEIKAAQALGTSTEELSVTFGLSEGALRLLTQQTTASTAALKQNAEAAMKASAAYRDFLNFVGEREIEDAERVNKAREDLATQNRDLLNDIGMREIDDVERANKAKEQSDREWRQFQNDIGERALENEAARLAKQRELIAKQQKPWKDMIAGIKMSLGNLEDATVGNLGSLLFGIGNDPTGELKRTAEAAKQEYLKIQRSGKATAEELQLAFHRWHEAEDRANATFGARFLDVWRSIKTSISDILNDVLKLFTNTFLTGLLGSLRGQQGAMASAFKGLLGGASSSLWGGIGQVAGGAAVPGLIGIGSAGSVAADVAGVAAAAGGGAGIGATLGALATNPWTIGIAAGIAGFFGLKKLLGGGEQKEAEAIRQQFGQQFGGLQNLANRLSRIPDGLLAFSALQNVKNIKNVRFGESAVARALAPAKVKMFNLGGFVPPGIVQPAILHGGLHGEDIIPRTASRSESGARPLQVQIVNHISTIDASGVRDFVESAPFLHSVARVFERNAEFIQSRVQRSFS